MKDAVKLGPEERGRVLQEARRAQALVLTMVFQDGTTQLDPEQVSNAHANSASWRSSMSCVCVGGCVFSVCSLHVCCVEVQSPSVRAPGPDEGRAGAEGAGGGRRAPGQCGVPQAGAHPRLGTAEPGQHPGPLHQVCVCVWT